MRVLVGYVSQTGNTKKVAEAIFGEIEGEKEIKKLDQIKNMKGYDLAFLGFPVRAFGPDKKAKKFLQTQCRGKKIALFITHASPEDHHKRPRALAEDRCGNCETDARFSSGANRRADPAPGPPDRVFPIFHHF